MAAKLKDSLNYLSLLRGVRVLQREDGHAHAGLRRVRQEGEPLHRALRRGVDARHAGQVLAGVRRRRVPRVRHRGADRAAQAHHAAAATQDFLTPLLPQSREGANSLSKASLQTLAPCFLFYRFTAYGVTHEV